MGGNDHMQVTVLVRKINYSYTEIHMNSLFAYRGAYSHLSVCIFED